MAKKQKEIYITFKHHGITTYLTEIEFLKKILQNFTKFVLQNSRLPLRVE